MAAISTLKFIDGKCYENPTLKTLLQIMEFIYFVPLPLISKSKVKDVDRRHEIWWGDYFGFPKELEIKRIVYEWLSKTTNEE